MRSVVVTGHLGYVGKILTRRLIESGFYVIGIDLKAPSNNLITDRMASFNCDLRNGIAMKRIFSQFRGIEACFHLAGRIEVGEGERQPELFHDINVMGTRNLLSALELSQKKHVPIIFASSAAVYGPWDRGIHEGVSTEATSVYGKTKIAGEAIIAKSKHPGIALRFFNVAGASSVYGLGEDHYPETHLIPNVIRKMKAGLPIEIFGNDFETKDGTCVRDYVHVEDVVDACMNSLTHLTGDLCTSRFMVYNIASGVPTSNLEIFEKVKKYLKIEAEPVFAPRRDGDVGTLYASISKAKDELWWKPRRSSIDRIIKDAIKHEKKNDEISK